jgi:PIN domain nuclease of toxin-antitoxin system
MKVSDDREPLLLDTHVWIWWTQGEDRLAKKSSLVRRMEEAAEREDLWVSAISPWEIGMLEAKGRLELGRPCRAWVREALREQGVGLAPLSPEVAILSTRLDAFPHADPADRIIAATAIENGWTLVTADERLQGYMKSRRMPVRGI